VLTKISEKYAASIFRFEITSVLKIDAAIFFRNVVITHRTTTFTAMTVVPATNTYLDQ
jgi:hypothetical protein